MNPPRIPSTCKTLGSTAQSGPHRNIGSTPNQRRRYAITIAASDVPYLVPHGRHFFWKYDPAPFRRPSPIPQPADLPPYRIAIGYARTRADALDLALLAETTMRYRSRYSNADGTERPKERRGDAEHADQLLARMGGEAPRILETSSATTYPRHWTPGTPPPCVPMEECAAWRSDEYGDLLAGMARTLYLLDYANAVDPGDRTVAPQLSGPCAGPGSDWDHVAPPGFSLSAARVMDGIGNVYVVRRVAGLA